MRVLSFRRGFTRTDLWLTGLAWDVTSTQATNSARSSFVMNKALWCAQGKVDFRSLTTRDVNALVAFVCALVIIDWRRRCATLLCVQHCGGKLPVKPEPPDEGPAINTKLKSTGISLEHYGRERVPAFFFMANLFQREFLIGGMPLVEG